MTYHFDEPLWVVRGIRNKEGPTILEKLTAQHQGFIGTPGVILPSRF